MASASISVSAAAAAVSDPSAIDDAIFRRPIPARRADAEWEAIVRHLTDSLGQLLAVELDVVEFSVVDAVALSCTLQSRNSISGPLDIRLQGLVGIESIDDAPYVYALLFLYSLRHRLAVEGHAASFIDCVYERQDRDVGRWRLKGWRKDEYEEFAGLAPRLLTPG